MGGAIHPGWSILHACWTDMHEPAAPKSFQLPRGHREIDEGPTNTKAEQRTLELTYTEFLELLVTPPPLTYTSSSVYTGKRNAKFRGVLIVNYYPPVTLLNV